VRANALLCFYDDARTEPSTEFVSIEQGITEYGLLEI
jgi:hypothetical protein